MSSALPSLLAISFHFLFLNLPATNIKSPAQYNQLNRHLVNKFYALPTTLCRSTHSTFKTNLKSGKIRVIIYQLLDGTILEPVLLRLFIMDTASEGPHVMGILSWNCIYSFNLVLLVLLLWHACWLATKLFKGLSAAVLLLIVLVPNSCRLYLFTVALTYIQQ